MRAALTIALMIAAEIERLGIDLGEERADNADHAADDFEDAGGLGHPTYPVADHPHANAEKTEID
jgi:hypothetical protein